MNQKKSQTPTRGRASTVHDQPASVESSKSFQINLDGNGFDFSFG